MFALHFVLFLYTVSGSCFTPSPHTTTTPCPENQFWDPNATCSDTCEFPNAHECPLKPWPRCSCIEGYVEITPGSRCVLLKDCPPPSVQCKGIKCPPGEHCVVNTIYCIKAPCPQPPPRCEQIPVGK
ncbi:hypothetical protein L596_013651 [Steinernema carpocapsae]|uniref:TIL domain-containing protein n=1 Tax=Steinernema carpocapsae TaxID=34508 RepID=A0A4U5P1A0_STECR|nr:hypothetical protein L596_013651 [Steinernema carpocapsae]